METASKLTRHPIFADIEMGIGTSAWGDRLFWGYGLGFSDVDIQEAFDHCIEAGIRLFDTAETYGSGKSESLLGVFLENNPHNVKIMTKFMPFPWRVNRHAFKRALGASLERLKRNKVDIYMMHWPYPPISINAWMEAMAEAHDEGLIDAVGVSNYSRDQMLRACEMLVKHGIRLAVNEVEYNLLDRSVETNGLLLACRDLGVALIAYSPLARGVLTGKYTVGNPVRGIREQFYSRKLLEDLQPLIREMRKIGLDHDGKTPAQVAINWLICKGALPIPGVKNLTQAQQNAGAKGWRLLPEAVARLDEYSQKLHSGR
jgi:aryl-alcohol dehydrogenase-like predicted oxidoreductase